MPSRFVSLVILDLLVDRRILPSDVGRASRDDVGLPPDLRSITQAVDSTQTDAVEHPGHRRYSISRRTPDRGGSGNRLSRRPDGWFELTSRVELDAGGLLKGTAFLSRSSIQLEIESRYRVDPSGNLHSFLLEVKSPESPETLVEVKGEVKGKMMEIVSRGPVDILNKKMMIEYEPRSVIQDVLGPLDRLPGLHVGQRWESQVINPFTGQVSRCASRGEEARPDPLERQPCDNLRGRADTWPR